MNHRDNENRAIQAYLIAKRKGHKLGKIERHGKAMLRKRRNAIDRERATLPSSSDKRLFIEGAGRSDKAASQRDKRRLVSRHVILGTAEHLRQDNEEARKHREYIERRKAKGLPAKPTERMPAIRFIGPKEVR